MLIFYLDNNDVELYQPQQTHLLLYIFDSFQTLFHPYHLNKTSNIGDNVNISAFIRMCMYLDRHRTLFHSPFRLYQIHEFHKIEYNFRHSSCFPSSVLLWRWFVALQQK